MNTPLSKQKMLTIILQTVKYIVFILLFSLSVGLFSEEIDSLKKTTFLDYLLKRLQQSRFDERLIYKFASYVSNPSNGYKNVGITSEELSRVVREYIDENFLNIAVDSVMKAAGIDTFDTTAFSDKSENIQEYIRHIRSLTDRYGLQLTNLQNRFLVITLDGDPPPLGLVGKIRVSSNFIHLVEPHIVKDVLYATGINGSKTAVDLAIISMGILKEINLKPSNRVHLFVDLSLLKTGNNVDILYNLFELAPVNFILDSYFPYINAEFGYAKVNIVQNIEGFMPDTYIRKIEYNGSEYGVPDTAILCLNKDKISRSLLKKKILNFQKMPTQISINMVEDNKDCIRLEFKLLHKNGYQNALDFVVLFLCQNGDLYDNRIKLFEFLKENVVFDHLGKRLGINKSHTLLKRTEVILKGIEIGKQGYSAYIYIRFPFGIGSTLLVERLKQRTGLFNKKENTSLEVYISSHNPIIMDPNSQPIIILKKAYQEVIGRSLEPQVSDGLYTKLFPHAIGVGPRFLINSKVDVNTEDRISTQDLLNILKIYTTALIYMMTR